MILDYYFRRPLFWDYFLSIVIALICFKLVFQSIICLPNDQEIVSIASDITNISLTISGFILTILTVLITFKTGNKVKQIDSDTDEPLFDLFFATGLYFETVKHLKNCIKSLVLISVLGFGLKLFLSELLKPNLYYFNIVGLLIIAFTLFRSLLILSKVIELQKNDFKN